MTTLDPHPSSHPTADPAAATADAVRRPRWALLGAVTGLLGVGATLITDVHPVSWATRTTTPDIVDDLSRGTAHASVALGFAVVVGLLVLSAAWRRHVEARAAHSTAARVVTHGLLAGAGALSLGYGYKGMLAIYLPGGINGEAFDRDALYVMYVLNDFGSFIGWLGVTVAAGAVAWMSLRERLISRWIGFFSLLPVAAVGVLLLATGLPGFPGVATPVWMVVAFTGLFLGRSPVTR